jgi:ABC-type polysaccharide/polyol phosphate transport system ATPase subunit
LTARGSIRAQGVGRRFEVRAGGPRSLKDVLFLRQMPSKRELWALRDVSLDVAAGEALGVVGQNGSGKSTLLKLMARIFAPSEGTLDVTGDVGSLLEIGAGFHPEFSGVENVYLNAAIYGLSRAYVDEHLEEIVSFAELEDFAHAPVKTYSSGMLTRLGFSVATHLDPDILLVDEVLAVGDEAFQRKCFEKIWEFKKAGGTIVFVSHDPVAVEHVCSRAILLDRGHVAEEGAAEDVVRAYHRRLAGRTRLAATTVDEGTIAPCTILEVLPIAGDGLIRERFVEGEPVLFEARLYSDAEIQGARVTMTVREESGRELASQTVEGVDLRPERPEAVRLHVPSLPLHEGHFLLDVAVKGYDGGTVLASRERALELTVMSDDESSAGPVRLGGVWELPQGVAGRLTQAADG